MALIKYPIGIQSFSVIREGGYVYVDKTGYLHQLLSEGSKYVFLSRPRRFGKSLFLSMIEEFFLGHRHLFDGLEITRHEYDWQRHPVLHLDFTGRNFNAAGSLDAHINSYLEIWESIYGDEKNDRAPEERLAHIIMEAHRITGKKVIILIDEYDKPLLETVDNPQLQNAFRNILRGVYGNLKSQDAHIEFAMLTGVTKFGHLSIFSDLNNLQDISMNRRYSGICGITDPELRSHFGEGVANFAKSNGLSADEAYEMLRINYDGYHFSPVGGFDVYNPFSILNALNDEIINDYWFKTGTPTFLIKLIKAKGISIQNLENLEVDVNSVTSVSFDYNESLYPVLYQSGYLTIKGYRPLLNRIRLGFPNREVEQGFFGQLVKIYVPVTQDDSGFAIANFYDDIMAGDAQAFMVRLRGLFSDFNRDGFNRISLEQHYQDVVFIIMKLLGFYTHIEYKTASGRIDLLVKTPDYIYVFEFKMDRTPQEALSQINSSDYLLPFSPDRRKLIKIGANFSSKTRSIDGWAIEAS